MTFRVCYVGAFCKRPPQEKLLGQPPIILQTPSLNNYI